jgi:hypothetical protein
MSVIVKTVNYIHPKHRISRVFLEKVNTDREDLLYHAEPGWLSRGIARQHLITLKQQRLNFFENNEKEFPDRNK